VPIGSACGRCAQSHYAHKGTKQESAGEANCKPRLSLASILFERGYRFYRETDLSPYSAFEEMLKFIPSDGTINAVASSRPLAGLSDQPQGQARDSWKMLKP
jgi:hypothetical protein